MKTNEFLKRIMTLAPDAEVSYDDQGQILIATGLREQENTDNLIPCADTSDVLIMVLNDGETFSNLDGCAIVRVPDAYARDGTEGIERWLDEENGVDKDGTVVVFSETDDGRVRMNGRMGKGTVWEESYDAS